jgi:hypothetical protein
MSASNWAVCPKCIAKARADARAEYRAVMESYGTIPVAEFDAKHAALKDPDEGDYETFREDYEIYGAESGEVQVTYSGSCGTCGLNVELRESKRFYTVPGDA